MYSEGSSHCEGDALHSKGRDIEAPGICDTCTAAARMEVDSFVEPADVDISHKEGREVLADIPRAGRLNATIQLSSNDSRDYDVVRVVSIIR